MDIVKIVKTAIKNGKIGNYSEENSSEAIRKAMLEANDGSTKINPKTFYRGSKIFNLVQDILPVMINEGIAANKELAALIEYRNIAEGDVNEFILPAGTELVVRDTAAGILGVRRQKLAGGQTIAVETKPKYVKVYDDLTRFLSGRIDFNELVERVSKAFVKKVAEDAYICLNAVTKDTPTMDGYVTGGTFDEEELVTLIEHVRAENPGATVRIMGDLVALSKVTTANGSSEKAQNDLYDLGYYGKFRGVDMVWMAQAHQADGKTFVLDSNKIFVIASNDKPLKVVNEGEGYMFETAATENADATQEYTYIQPVGVAFAPSAKMGIYTLSK